MDILKSFLLLSLLTLNLNLMSDIIPVEDFYKKSDIGSVRISPSGKYLSTKISLAKTSAVVITERATNKTTHIQHFGEDSFVGDYLWLTDERIAFSLRKKNAAYARPWFMGQLEAINADGSSKKMIIGSENVRRATRVARNDIGRTGFYLVSRYKEDKDHILIGMLEKDYPTLFMVNIHSGKKSKIATSPAMGGDIILDTNNEFRLSIGENIKNQRTIYYRDSLDSEWELHGVYSMGQGEVIPYAFSPDNSFLYATCNIEASTDGICKYFPKTKTTELIYRNENVDASTWIDRDTHELLSINVYDGKGEEIWMTKSALMVKKMRALEKVFPNHSVSLADSTENRDELIIYVSSDTDPGGYYSFKTKTNELKDLGLSPRGWINPSDMSPMEPISYQARDGLTIHGYLTRPKGQKNNLPLIVLVHGGPHGVRDYWGHDREVQHLASRGFAIVQLNYRGSGGYGREFLKSGFNHWGDTMQDDLTDGVNWLVDQGIADKERLCIYGASYGGYAAMMSSAREPDLYKCAVGYVGVYDVDSFTTVGNIPGYRAGSAYLKDVIPADPAKRDAFSPSMQASKIKAEVFLIHGKKDRQAHFNNYEIMTEKFDDLNKPYKSLVKFDEEHGFYKTENVIELAYDLEEFFMKHIGSPK